MILWAEVREGRTRIACPVCGKGKGDKSCGVTKNGDAGIAHCFRCGLIERMGHGSEVPRIAFSPRPTKERKLSDYWRDLWNECVPLRGVAVSYLSNRGCCIPPADGHLRFHPNLKHSPSNYRGPALVALITDAESGDAISLHRTWIQANGDKAQIEPVRMYAAGHEKQGGVVRLWPDDAITNALGVAEGVETALSLAHALQPCWATLDAGNLRELFVLPDIASLVIAVDHDPAGIRAATACAERWTAAGCEVRMVMPDERKADLNDVARAAA